MRIIGLTGGIASGKSLVLNEFQRVGISIISADAIAREIFYKKDVLIEVKKIFGTVDRNRIANIIFSNSKKKKLLEKIIHPKVVFELRKQIDKLRKRKLKIVIVDIPLLYEVGLEYLFNKIIVVNCSKEQQIERLIKRDKISIKEALKKIKSQITLSNKINKADYVIDNKDTKSKIKKEVKKILDKIL
ncbi:MAG: dephospho-CoA kinase [Elusimicrobia bacterium RIFOXYD2_FULL_34_15]|nr:MAG: dephospho-CoA kinase [Elusimicrobia bacterium RIFOXYD2_FULL_34_15]